MKNYYEQTVGEIVEQLIRIKDRGSVITRCDIESINNACNILSHTFNRNETAGRLINECFANVRFNREDVKEMLKSDDYEPSDENTDIVISSIEDYLMGSCTEHGYDVLCIAIDNYGSEGKLKPISEEEQHEGT